MARVTMLLIVANLVLLVFALIDCLSTDRHALRGLPKSVWILAIIFLSPIGAIGYLIAGRPDRTTTDSDGVSGPVPAGGDHSYRRPQAPDDDPEFLRSLAARNRHGGARPGRGPGGLPAEPHPRTADDTADDPAHDGPGDDEPHHDRGDDNAG
jgi:hypothetical protein